MVTELLTYDSQEVEYFREKNIFKLKINEPFHSAKKMYNWNTENPEGIGINEKLIKLASKLDALLLIEIDTLKKFFTIDAWIIESFCQKFNSIYKIKQISLYVYPIENLNKVEDKLERQMIQEKLI